MKHLLGLVLAVLLLFAAPAVCLAVPVAGAGEGEVVVFADRDWGADNLGLGFGINDRLTLGAVYDFTFDNYGIYATFELDAFLAQIEIWHGELITATGLWRFDLAPVTMGLGGGLDHGPTYDQYFVSAAVSVAIGENLALYGSVRYFPDPEMPYPDEYLYRAGIAFEF